MSLNILQWTGQSPTIKNDLAPSVNHAMVEKHWVIWYSVEEKPLVFGLVNPT